MSSYSHILTRRAFLRSSLASGVALSGLGALPGLAQSSGDVSQALLPPDANGLRLLPGFRSRVVARSGEPPTRNSSYRWHAAPDGGAVFPTPQGGWVYVSNSEMNDGAGGVGALRFSPSGEVEDAYPILQGTTRNCAGGAMPWNTWLSCEEFDRGQVWECDPFGERAPVLRSALGTFNHEAAALDTRSGLIYLTEDERDGRLYRFVAERFVRSGVPDLAAGQLEVARMDINGMVDWLPLPDPLASSQATRDQVRQSTAFNGGEGMVYANGKLVFTTKGDNRVWSYDAEAGQMSVIYDPETHSNPILSGVDNLALTPMGSYAVAEDGGDMQIVVLTPQGRVVPLVQVIGQDDSEIAGPAFSPDWSRLYFSSQRGTSGRSENGITYEITGPFAL